jgi:hypothetical protein
VFVYSPTKPQLQHDLPGLVMSTHPFIQDEVGSYAHPGEQYRFPNTAVWDPPLPAGCDM